MEVLLNYPGDDIGRGGEAAVGGDAPDVIGQFLSSNVLHGGRAHAHAAKEQISGAEMLIVVIDPPEHILSLMDTEGDVFAVGFSVGPVTDQEQIQPQIVVPLENAAEVRQIVGTVTVDQNDGGSGVLCRDPLAPEGQAVKALGGDVLCVVLPEPLGGGGDGDGVVFPHGGCIQGLLILPVGLGLAAETVTEAQPAAKEIGGYNQKQDKDDHDSSFLPSRENHRKVMGQTIPATTTTRP